MHITSRRPEPQVALCIGHCLPSTLHKATHALKLRTVRGWTLGCVCHNDVTEFSSLWEHSVPTATTTPRTHKTQNAGGASTNIHNAPATAQRHGCHFHNSVQRILEQPRKPHTQASKQHKQAIRHEGNIHDATHTCGEHKRTCPTNQRRCQTLSVPTSS